MDLSPLYINTNCMGCIFYLTLEEVSILVQSSLSATSTRSTSQSIMSTVNSEPLDLTVKANVAASITEKNPMCAINLSINTSEVIAVKEEIPATPTSTTVSEGPDDTSLMFNQGFDTPYSPESHTPYLPTTSPCAEALLLQPTSPPSYSPCTEGYTPSYSPVLPVDDTYLTPKEENMNVVNDDDFFVDVEGTDTPSTSYAQHQQDLTAPSTSWSSNDGVMLGSSDSEDEMMVVARSGLSSSDSDDSDSDVEILLNYKEKHAAIRKVITEKKKSFSNGW